MISVPQEIVERIKFFCESEGLGMAEVTGPEFVIFMIGNNNLSPDQVSLLAAYSLLKGIIFGNLTKENELASSGEELKN